ncbi:MAG: ABC transporter ATP-binding protein, partial [Candidatus Heimdallarchaeota archaeon]
MTTTKLEEKTYDKTYSDTALLSRFWKYLTAYKLQLFFIIILILAMAGVSIIPPIMVERAYNLLVEGSGNWQVVAPFAIAYVGLSILLWILQVVLNILVTIITQKIIKRIQMETYRSLQEHDLGFFDKQATGEIMSRLTNDTQELNDMINVVAQFFSNFVIVFAVLGIMFAVNWRLALITLGMGPIVFAAALLFRRVTRRTSGKWRAAIGEVNASFQESVSGIHVAKAFGRERKSKEEFEIINDTTFQYARKRAFALTGIWPVMDGISVLGIFSINLFGSWLVIEGFSTDATVLFFILLLNRFLYPLARVASQISTIQSGFAAMERVFSIIDAEKAIKNPENPIFKNIDGLITFEQVYQHYVPETPVIKNLNLTIKPGESIAIVGETGAGKTTIASLLMRFYDINKGSIKIDGVDIRDYDLHNLRSQIGLV